jgi:UDP-N-acetylmuramate--alanine ligase
MTINSPQWVQARTLKPNDHGGFDFSAMTNMGAATEMLNVSLQVPGEHNVRNALAALSVAAVMGLSLQMLPRRLSQFTGTGRRFEVRGEPKGVLLVDDYAHHPTEIRATLAGARARYPNAAFGQSGSRIPIRGLRPCFMNSRALFKDADEVLVTEVYASREAKQEI